MFTSRRRSTIWPRSRRQYDLVVASDGLDSRTRRAYQEHFCPQIEFGTCKFQWLGTSQKFDEAVTFIFEQTEHGLVWAYAYQFDANTATFIVECSHATWEAFGFESMSHAESAAVCERLFAEHLGGHALLSDARNAEGSAWLNFAQVQCKHWSHRNVVLLGDAAATTHFSIGGGTQLAMEGAVTLAQALVEEASVPKACAIYEGDRHRVAVRRLQSAARDSMTWFEGVARYADLDPIQFTYSLLTRSQRIGHEKLRLRDPQWLENAGAMVPGAGRRAEQLGAHAHVRAYGPARPPGSKTGWLSPPSHSSRQSTAPRGTGTWVHYAERAKGGAGLVTTEMTTVNPEGRITPGCPGLYADEHTAAWRRITEFVHQESRGENLLPARAFRAEGLDPDWMGDDEHAAARWQLAPAGRLSRGLVLPEPATAGDDREGHGNGDGRLRERGPPGRRGRLRHAGAALRPRLPAFHVHHPITNQRQDQYGGSLENRLRFPTQVLRAVRAAWPAHKPISVRISANDWVDDEGITPEASVEVAVAFKRAGADICHAASGHTSTRAKPAYGRMFQTPLADRIRNEGHMPTIAVGSIYKADQVNSILLAGRADLVCMARPHLANPYWTLHVAAGLCDHKFSGHCPYLAGRDQLQHLAEQGEIARGVGAWA